MKIPVSLIIPVYNGEKYLADCFNCITRQNLPGLQVIFVNDGSSDGSLKLLKDFCRDHPDFTVIDQSNGGLSAARNAGLAAAEGEYVDFLDCDDSLADGALGILYGHASRERLDMLFYDGRSVYETEETRALFPGYENLYRTKEKINGVYTGQQLMVRLTESGSYRASACMYLVRRDFLITNGLRFIPGIYYEDNVFTASCLVKAERTAVLAEPFYQRLVHAGSIVTVHKNYRHARSYYISWLELNHLVSMGGCGTAAAACIQHQTDNLYLKALEVYSSLSAEEIEAGERMYPDACALRALMPLSCGNRAAEPAGKTDKKQELWPRDILNTLCTEEYKPEAPLVSVVLPVYNGERLLGETIRDLQKQTLKNFEMIFVDDGSGDESTKIISAAAESDPRIHLIRQVNQYAGVARNNGLKAACGKYTVFLDSDDRFAQDLLAHACARAEATQADIVIWNADIYRSQSGTLTDAAYLCACDRLPAQPFTPADAGKEIFCSLNPWTKLYRTACIRDLGIQYQALYSSNDLFFTTVAMANAGRIAPLPEKLVHYRVDEGAQNIQSTKSKAPLDTFTAFAGVRQELERRGVYEQFRKPFAAKAAESVLRSLDTFRSLESYKALYDRLHDGGFEELDLKCLSSEDMTTSDGPAKLIRCRQIMEMPFEVYALKNLQQTLVPSNGGAVPAGALDEIKALRSSAAYRIGTRITWLPHKIKMMLKRL